MRSTTRLNAGSPWRTDWPKSPRSAPERKRPYWTTNGSLNPITSRKRCTSSADASGGKRTSAGSPVRWRMKKTTNETPKRTSSDCRSRRVTYVFMEPVGDGPPPRCAASGGTCPPAAPTRADSPRRRRRRGRGRASRGCTRRRRAGPARARRGRGGPSDGIRRAAGRRRRPPPGGRRASATEARGDRKSTRLNSSHRTISYAVFCLKKKKKTQQILFIKKKQKKNNKY